jgi:hypothetical protein
VTVTSVVGEFRKLVQTQRSPLDGCHYHVHPEPVSRNAALIPCQDLYPRTVLERIFMRPITCSVPLLVQGTSLRLRKGQAIIPIKHSVTVPMFTQADQ